MSGSGQSIGIGGNCWPVRWVQLHTRYCRALAVGAECVISQFEASVFSTYSKHIERAAAGASNRRMDSACVVQPSKGIASVN